MPATRTARPKPATQVLPDMVSMKRNATGFCPVRDVLDRVGDQWSVLVLFSLAERVMRFGELKKHIGDISPRVLTQTLRYLEQDGLVTRKMFATIPPRVDYTITDLGRSLTESMKPVIFWAMENQAAIQQSRQEAVKAKATQ